ncbi:MAG: Sir2 family NAD-dependent protein deacetylase [Tissierellia bacterium]|nr:Sir2 family NAD-dependent protein deacetylase [Tissierellia bacterium]
MDKIKKAAELIVNSRKVMVLTGAGISTESGIPDFRSAEGYYSKMDPTLALSKDRLLNQPELFYKEGYMILLDLNDKEPNKGHRALAELEKIGAIDGIITQNIDNLHFKAGNKKVYEVHGETRGVHCLNCQEPYDFSVMKEKVDRGEIPPHCDNCQEGVLRPNVVMFGDMMPTDFSMAMDELEGTETLIVVGSSLTVAPVNFMPRYVDHLIIINKDQTPEDRRADFVFHESCSGVLEQLAHEVKALQ